MWDWLINETGSRLAGGEVTVRLTQLWWPLLSLLTLAAVVAFAATVYRRDGGTRVARGIGIALRSLLLVLLLVLIWQPVVRVEHLSRESGVVAVLLDVSASMATADNYGPDDPLVVALAAVGRLSLDDGGGSAATQPAEIIRNLNADSRLTLVRKALTGHGSRAVDALLANNEVRFYAFSQQAQPMGKIARHPRAADQPDGAGLAEAMKALDGLTADGQATSIGQAVADVLNELRGQRLAGLVVISDGRSNVESNLDAAVELATSRFASPVPIHAVTVGSNHPPRDVGVAKATAEQVVFVRDLVAVKAVVTQHGYDQPQRVAVRLAEVVTDADGEERLVPLSEEAVTVGQADADGRISREVETELRYQPQRAGNIRLAVTVDPPAGDLNPKNNRAAAHIEVKDARIRVLYVEGYPRWDYRFIVNSLSREKSVKLSVWLASADPDYVQLGTEPITRLPVSPEEWKVYDVVLFGDVDPFDLTIQQMEQIEQFVRERGGGLAVIAGDRHCPQRYVNSPLAKLLPVEIDRSAGADRTSRKAGFPLALTDDGRRSPILRFEHDPKMNEDTIRAFPPQFWFKPVLGLKPGAEVLAVHPAAVTADGGPAPLLVAGRYGAGRTYFSAIDGTWLWRRRTGVPFFDTYWLQLVRSLSRNKLLGSDRRFELSAAQTEYNEGQRAEVILQVLDKSLVGLPETLEATVSDSSGAAIDTVRLARAGTKGDLYTGGYRLPFEGDFTFSLDRNGVLAALGGATDGVSLPRTRVHAAKAGLENEQLSIDAESMRRLAGRTNGRVASLAELDRLAAAIPDLSQPRDDDDIIPLWNTPLALLLFASLITAEWIVRKKYNLQ